MDNYIEQVKDIIVSQVNPDQIILFGSRARDEYREDSDYDFLVLKKGLVESKETTQNLRKILYKSGFREPMDIIVMNREKYLNLVNVVGYVYKVIKREGKVIYEQS